MSNFNMPCRLPADGHNGNGHLSALGRLETTAAHDFGSVDGWGEDDALRAELEQLTASHKELLAQAGVPETAPQEEPADLRETAQLRAENARLRARVEEVERQLQAATQGKEQTWDEQQREYEALLEEKSEVIRGLFLKIQEQKVSPAEAPTGADDNAASVSAFQQELQQLRAQMEAQRRQLEEDELAVQEQMKQMELTLSRERVGLARQRTELQRLQNDFQHELETAARDEKLRERLLPLQRRNQELTNSKGAGTAPVARPSSAGQLPRPTSAGQLQRPASAPQLGGPGADDTPRKSGSGLMRRLFGGKSE